LLDFLVTQSADGYCALCVVQAWCARRQLVLFVLALNIALAVAFYRLLYE